MGGRRGRSHRAGKSEACEVTGELGSCRREKNKKWAKSKKRAESKKWTKGKKEEKSSRGKRAESSIDCMASGSWNAVLILCGMPTPVY